MEGIGTRWGSPVPAGRGTGVMNRGVWSAMAGEERIKALLVLEDGSVYPGTAFAGRGEVLGEVVFNTSMSGYQEVLTDPSYRGQIVTMTYTQIGNYGINPADMESWRPWVEGFIVRELCEKPSNWRSSFTLREYLTQSGTVALQGIDTRALTRHLRVAGVMMGAISTELTRAELKNTLDSAPYYGNLNFVERVSTKEAYEWSGDECSRLDDCLEPKCHIALIDLGIKRNIARCLARQGCRVTILPCSATAVEVMLEARRSAHTQRNV